MSGQQTTPLAGHGLSNAQAEDVIRRTLALLCCAVRFAPRWHAAVVDEHNGSVWVRKRHIFTAGGGSPRHSYVRLDRAKTWGQLIRHWSLLGLDPVVDLALDLLCESVAERIIAGGVAPKPAAAFGATPPAMMRSATDSQLTADTLPAPTSFAKLPRQ